MNLIPTARPAATREGGRLLPRASTPAEKNFSIALYQEHLEEASFLYEQRLVLLDDPELTWLDIDAFEGRFEAHIDALVCGGGGALEVARERASEGEPGELHAAILLFCRLDRLDLVIEIIDALDPEDQEKISALCNALNREMPGGWLSKLLIQFSRGYPVLDRVVAGAIGYQRQDLGAQLVDALSKNESLTTLCWALGRLREKRATLLLIGLLQHDDGAIRSAALLALLRLGDPDAISFCQQRADTDSSVHIPMGLSGGKNAARTLLEIGASESAGSECLLALGLLGDPAAAPLLHTRLKSDELAESAALALNLITGADLFEEVEMKEEMFEEELFDDEPADGPTTAGVKLIRLSRDSEVWKIWWNQNRERFEPGIRYRNGVRYSPEVVLSSLRNDRTPRLLRTLAYEELVIRYRLDAPFETDMPVIQQLHALATYSQWMETNPGRFPEGRWIFGGNPIP